MAKTRDKLRQKAKENINVSAVDNNQAFDDIISRAERKEIIIDPILKSFIPPLQDEELQLLKDSIEQEGVREDLILWNDPERGHVLVDGHNRMAIIKGLESEGKTVKYGKKFLELPDFESVKDWMIINQLGRRNLTNEQRSYLRGLRYERDKKKKTNSKGVNQFNKGKVNRQNDEQPTHIKLAEEYKVSPKTIERDASFAKGINFIGSSNPELKQEILAGKEKVKKSSLQKLGKYNGKQKPVFKSVNDIEKFVIKVDSKEVVKLTENDNTNAFVDLKKEAMSALSKLSDQSNATEFDKLKTMLDSLKKEALDIQKQK
ncbi:MAG: hypothetical protein CMO01_14150 [Thalassobius sp.]|nr:hypothetical protein [Thalassovita sp.]